MERMNTPGSAEQRAAGLAARGVHRHDGDGLVAGAQHAHERIEERRLPRTRGAGHADARRTGKRALPLECVQHLEGSPATLGAPVVGEVERFGDGVALSREQALRDLRQQRATPPRRPRSRP
jgi:hypothetical protein